ncbi:MAG: TolC family protein [Planctomycetes bacterium]|nr:TolC family protein [Planctomycetota bacterium]
MKRATAYITVLVCLFATGFSGCHWQQKEPSTSPINLGDFSGVSTEIEYPDVEAANYGDVATTPPPFTFAEPGLGDYWDLSLQDAIHMALKNSKVLRDLGGAILQSPENVATIHDPAIAETNPQFGIDAALSEFDANWSTSAYFEKNDRALNNQFFGGGTRLLKQDLFDYTSQLTKRSAVGTDMTLRHNMTYDFNNAPGNNDPNLPWATNLEGELRQPILQGGGATFNRIAGPGGRPGIYNGVLIARVNTDIQLAEFEVGVRNLVSDVETAYWELYYAYRYLEAKLSARDRALETWRIVKALGGRVDADKEAQAAEQYFRLEEEVQNALRGRLLERAGARQTVFRGVGGVHQNELRLRLLMGVPINDGKVIRPVEEPEIARVIFNWEDILSEALLRRPEIRRQKWRVKQRELELVAARNFIKPQLDLIGRWRWRGLGRDLISPNGSNRVQFDNAVDNLLSGAFQEWQLGMEFSFGVGRRQGHAAIRHAELKLARESALMDEQQRDVAHDLSNSIGELDRAYISAKLNYNRRIAAKQQLAALEAKALGRDIRDRTRYLDLILDAQRRLADSQSKYYQSLVEYMMAVKTVHYTKGSLLSYNEIRLAEDAWPEKAYHDAARRARLRMGSWKLTNFIMKSPPYLSHGPGGPGIGEDLNPNPTGFDHTPEMPSENLQDTSKYLEPANLPNSPSLVPLPASFAFEQELSNRRAQPTSTLNQPVSKQEDPLPTFNLGTVEGAPRKDPLGEFRDRRSYNSPGETKGVPSPAPRKSSVDLDDANPHVAGFDGEAMPIVSPAVAPSTINTFFRFRSLPEEREKPRSYSLPTNESEELNSHPLGFDRQPTAVEPPARLRRPAEELRTSEPRSVNATTGFRAMEYFNPSASDSRRAQRAISHASFFRITDEIEASKSSTTSHLPPVSESR